jgi:predicted nuclease with TOPRIM domain
MGKIDLSNLEKDYLVTLVEDLQGRLQQKDNNLKSVKTKLSNTKQRLQKLKDVIKYQRDRIIELT